MGSRTNTLLVARSGPVPGLLELLRSHPCVGHVEETPVRGIEFEQGAWKRRVLAGSRDCELRGLVELMDNNPLVCADEASVPSAESTLALVAIGPALRAGLVTAMPKLRFDFAADAADLSFYLETCGWRQGCEVEVAAGPAEGVLACEATVPIRSEVTPEEIEVLYEEAFGRAFYVRRQEGGDWNPSATLGRPFAVFEVELASGIGATLRARAAADARGKCGAAQLVHCMNVMAGLEESLGIPE